MSISGGRFSTRVTFTVSGATLANAWSGWGESQEAQWVLAFNKSVGTPVLDKPGWYEVRAVHSADPGNPDVVYQLDVSADVTISISLIATDFIPAL